MCTLRRYAIRRYRMLKPVGINALDGVTRYHCLKYNRPLYNTKHSRMNDIGYLEARAATIWDIMRSQVRRILSLEEEIQVTPEQQARMDDYPTSGTEGMLIAYHTSLHQQQDIHRAILLNYASQLGLLALEIIDAYQVPYAPQPPPPQGGAQQPPPPHGGQ